SAAQRKTQPSPAHNRNTGAADGCEVETDAAADVEEVEEVTNIGIYGRNHALDTMRNHLPNSNG
ncbi:hypothetical protein A2U01_0110833, partial [Trifolium medium]|nr:hypothetical protein [Trifolium medium]